MAEQHSDAHSHEHSHESEHHVVSIPMYLTIFGILIAGTILTVVVANINFDAYLFAGANTLLALLIAFAKTSAVVLIFMHVWYNSKLIWLTVLSGFIWLCIMFALTMQDFLTRTPGTFSN